MRRILYEDTMPYAGEFLSQLGHVTSYSWQTLKPEHLIDVDVLAIRSTTKITPELLAQANALTTIATATAGTNHMDIEYLERQGLDWYAAGGCNAIAVAQYAVSAIMYADSLGEFDYRDIEVGIVGAGNVGSALSQMLDALNIGYVLCDPPIASTDPREFVSLERALQCDVISLHVPYVKAGPHPTGKLLAADQLSTLTEKQWLINACRGEVIDETALIALKKAGRGPQLVVDVWLNEPTINREYMSYARIATPHIAGHTDEGKIRGTQMVYDFLRKQNSQSAGYLKDIETPLTIEEFLPKLAPIKVGNDGYSPVLTQLLQQIYDINFDHRIFVENMAKSEAFSRLRKQYQGRREYSAYCLAVASDFDPSLSQILKRLGFAVTAQ